MSTRVIRPFDPWRSDLCTCPPKYTLNPYTGCSHMCLYCYATAYIGRRPSAPKRDLISSVRKDLRHIDRTRPINMSTSSDPYPPEEQELKLTREVLKILVAHGCRILITTKSNIVTRDIDILMRGNVAVMITITTLDDNLAKIIEPNAPSPSQRIEAVQKLASEGIPVGVRIDPVIPYVNDDERMLRQLVNEVVNAGARHIVTSSYKARPDNFRRLITAFPELENKLRKIYYEEGELVHGYRYLRPDLRKNLLRPVVDEAKRLGVTYATCREGLPEFRNAPSCDGSHLIPSRVIARVLDLF